MQLCKWQPPQVPSHLRKNICSGGRDTHTNTNTYTHTSSGAGERDTDTHTYIYTHKYKYIYTHKLVVRASIGTMTNEPTRVLYGAVISFRQPADLPVLVLRGHVDNSHKYMLAAVLC